MARPLRLEFAGALHHITSCGNERDAIFPRLSKDVRRLPGQPGRLVLEGGSGAGTVTMPGVGLEVGGPAINPVPRCNISDNVRAAAGSLLLDQGPVQVTRRREYRLNRARWRRRVGRARAADPSE
jgi:hypothetical protein